PAAYEVEREALGPELAAAFVPLEADEAALAFAAAAEAAPHGRLALGARALLRRVLTDFDANGLLGLHPMHVLSTAQWRRLLALPSGARLERVLDVGAGDGQVSESLRPLADALVTTELSRAMAWRLRRRGLPCHRLDLTDAPPPGEAPLSLTPAQNLLDRCARPPTPPARPPPPLRPAGPRGPPRRRPRPALRPPRRPRRHHRRPHRAPAHRRPALRGPGRARVFAPLRPRRPRDHRLQPRPLPLPRLRRRAPPRP